MDFTPEDERLIKEKWEELLQSCTKICKNDEDWEFIKRAFFLAKEAHGGVRRRSGEPYLLHPIAVAKIVVDEIGLGVKSVVAALLHDPSFNDELRQAAIYITDRKVIFNLVEAAHYQVKTAKQENRQAHSQGKAESKGDRTISLINNFLDTIPEEEKEKEKPKGDEEKKEEKKASAKTPHAKDYTKVDIKKASGTKVTDFETDRIDGGKLSQSYFSGGTITLVNVWSTT